MGKPLTDWLGNHSPFATCHSLSFGEPLFDDRFQRGADEFGDEFGRRVVRARAFPLRSVDQLKPPSIRHSPFAIRLNHRVVIEQAFVHRAEFLHVERGVVDAARRLRRAFAVIRQMPERFEQVAVGDGAGVEVARLEELAVERGCAQQPGELLVGEHFPEDAQTAPEVVVFGVGAAAVDEASEARDAVVLAVERIGADEPAILRNEEEQKTIDQAQELAVELFWGEWRMTS